MKRPWRIWPGIFVRASFSQERMTYIREESKVVYQSKGGKSEKVFDALEWLAAMTFHVHNKSEQIVRYYGYYSNVASGKRKKAEKDELIPSILESEGSSKEYRKNWARLIQKIYEVDPLTWPKLNQFQHLYLYITLSAFIFSRLSFASGLLFSSNCSSLHG